MKVLLVNPPGWQKGSTNLGLCYLAGSLLANGHEVLILDVNATDDPPEVVGKKAEEYGPGVIGFSLKTATANAALLLSKAIKKQYDKAVHVAGGAHVTLAYEECLLENPEIEYCFIGESDASFLELVKRLEQGGDPKKVAGIAYRDGKKIIATKREYIEDLDSLPAPSLEAIEHFSFKGFRYPMITSRGCPYPCTYCCVGVVSSKKWRARTPENIMAELKTVTEKYGIKSFEILDDNFTLRVERAKKFCRLLIESGMNLSWYCHNGIRADKIDMELARLMKKAGCTSVALGVESGDAKIFESIKKGEPLEAIVNAVKCIQAAGMEAVGYFIIGLPGDTLEGIKKTIKFQQSLGLSHFTYGILNPYPYTEVYDVIKREGKILMDIKESSHFSTTLTIPFEMPGFPREDMEKAYYLAEFQDLYKVLEEFEEKHNRKARSILYMDFSPASTFAETLAKVGEGCELDVFCYQWHSDRYFKNREAWNIKDLNVFIDTLGMVDRTKKFLKAFNLFRKRSYDIVFYNAETPQLLLAAFLPIVRPKKFYIEAQNGSTLMRLTDDEVKKAFYRKLRALPGFSLNLGLSVVFNPLFRLALLGFGCLLRLKKGGKKMVFESKGVRLVDMKEEGRKG
ncbi:MAG: B12-binding domain-containing radical SAM protein [Thermodesulfobacteriota bacterium]